MTHDSLPFEEKLDLKSWGLPDYIYQKYVKKGVGHMFSWQAECLMSGDVLVGGNLIYSAPTSAGKTLVAEILALKTVLERKKKVIIILPFVSVVREKMIYFQDILAGSGIRVEGFMGSYNPPGGFRAVHLAICTIEKANSLINRLLEERHFDDIGSIVVDELHLLGDPHRGYLLELLLTKLKYISLKGLSTNIQIIGMSATLPNLDVLARWLNATLYHTDFRPIPLFEYLKIGKKVYKSTNLNESREIKSVIQIQNDPGDVVNLCLDTILQGFSILVFCPTKNWCETLAVQISSEIKKLGNDKTEMGVALRNQLNSKGISGTLEQLRKCPAGLEMNLAKSVAFGVAYHHAGLTLDERDIVEGGFRQNILRVLVATSTLSSGVNLPARRVIIRSPGFQGNCMDILTYKQMIGRAGRMGKDTVGESYLICNEEDKIWGKHLVTSALPSVKSCLGQGDLSSSLKRALLEVIASGVVTNKIEVEEYTKCTLLAASVPLDKFENAINSCTAYLEKNEFIKINIDGRVLPSSLAEACLSASIAPDQALILLRELHKARQCFVLDSDLHAIYQVTPYSICDYWTVDWMRVFTVWEELPPNLQKTGELVGIEDRFLIRAMRGNINLNSGEYAHKISVHKRFYISLALQDLINEVPLNDVAIKYNCNKGMLQSLQQSASTFAAMVTSFCRRLGWNGLEVLLSELSTRIHFGVQKDLLDLLRLDCMTSIIARALHNSEIVSLSQLASSSITSVHTAINKAKPFQSEIIEKETQNRKDVYLPGRPGLSELEAADLLIHESRRFLLKEMGVKSAEWESPTTDNSVYEISTLCIEIPLTSSELKNETSAENKNAKSSKDSEPEPGSSKEQGPRGTTSNFTKHKPIQINDDITNTEEQTIVNCLIDSFDVCKGKDNSNLMMQRMETVPSISIGKNSVKEILPTLLNLDVAFDSLKKDDDDSFTLEIMPEDMCTIIPETQVFLSSLEKRCNVKCENSSLKKYIERHELIEEGEEEHERIHFRDINVSDSISFPAFQAANKLCSTFMSQEKTSVEKFSMEVLCGSPIKPDSVADIIGDNFRISKNSPLYKNVKCSTPIGTPGSGELSNLSNNDMFSESPQINDSRSKNCSNSFKKSIIEEFDTNWGGDSILELSQNLEKKLRQADPPISRKRKLVVLTDDVTVTNKKLCLSQSNEKSMKSDEEKPDLFKNHSFGDSITFDTQLENILNEGKKFTKAPNNVNLKKSKSAVYKSPGFGNSQGFRRKMSDGCLDRVAIQKEKDAITETFLANAFDGTFKLNELLKSNDANENNKNLADDIHILDSEDLINGSPETFQKQKGEFCLVNRTRSNRTLSTPQTNLSSLANVSPKSSPKRRVSPVKYPPISLGILKLTKSPSRGSTTQYKTPENSPRRKENVNSPRSHLVPKCNDNNITVDVFNTEADSDELIGDILKFKKMAFIIETKKLNDQEVHKNKIGGRIMRNIVKEAEEIDSHFKYHDKAIVGIYFYNGSLIYYFNMLNPEAIHLSKKLKCILTQKSIKLYGFELKDQCKMFYRCFEYNICCSMFDIAVAEWLLYSEEKFKSLPEFVWLKQHLLNYTIKHRNVFFNLLSYPLCRVTEYLKPDQFTYNEKDVSSQLFALWALQLEFSKKLIDSNLKELFEDVEMKVQSILLSMEVVGIGFEHDIANDLWSSSTELMGKLEMDAFSLAKHKFSLNSNSDFLKVKKELKINAQEEIDHPLVANVQNWRKLYSLKTRNLSQLLFKKDARIYSNCSIRSATGRILMFDPDLQHTPRDFTVGHKVLSLRAAFVADSGNVMVSADYSQLELRILAHFSQDPVLVPLFRRDSDVFRNIASEWNGLPADKVSNELRHTTKQLCYGIIYGMGDKALGDALGKSPAEASMFSHKFKRSFPKIDDFIKKTIEECSTSGKVKTLAGRVRHLPGIKSTNSQVRAQAERQAVNSKIQGSASDIAKKAMVILEDNLNRTFLERSSLPSQSHTSHLVIQLHDELVFEVRESLVDDFVRILKNAMETSTFLSVPLPVVIKIGKSWGQMKCL